MTQATARLRADADRGRGGDRRAAARRRWRSPTRNSRASGRPTPRSARGKRSIRRTCEREAARWDATRRRRPAGRHRHRRQGHHRHAPTCRRRWARRSSPATGRRATRPASRACARPARSCSARRSRRRSRSWTRARRAIRGTPRTRRADRRRDRRRRSRPAMCARRSARRPTARSSARPRIAASSASSRRSARFRSRACILFSETFDTVGTFTRTVEDAARLASVLADPGRIARIADAARDSRRASPTSATFRGPRPIATPTPSSKRRSTHLRRRADVVPVDIPPAWHEAKRSMRTIMLFEAARNLGDLQARERARLSPARQRGARRGPRDRRGRYRRGDGGARATRSRSSPTGSTVSTRCCRPSAPGAGAARPRDDRRPVVLHAVVAAGFPGDQPAGGIRAADADRPAAGGAARIATTACWPSAAWCGARLPFRGLV